jgi:NADPH2:quinone reductase
MRAIVQRRFGGPDELVLEETPDPTPGADQVRVVVEAAGVHLLDAFIRTGEGGGPFPIPDLPMTPGREVAGVIDAVGPGVDETVIGRRVVVHLGQTSGGYASMALAPAEGLIPLPERVDAAEAVAMVGTGRTALGILEAGGAAPGEVALVTAAAGGIGSLLVQALTTAGLTVVAVAGGPEKVALASSLGAALSIDYRSPAWADDVRSGLNGRPVDVVFESVGGDVGAAAVGLAGPGGRVVTYGWSSGKPFPDDVERAADVTIDSALGTRMMNRPGGIQGLAEEAVAKLIDGDWRPLLTHFPLAEAGAAHRALEDRRTTGKVVLIP